MQSQGLEIDFIHIRHAPPLCEAGYIYGEHVDVDLSDQGWLCATAMALPGNARWVTSPYPRAVETAAALLAHRPEGKAINPAIIPDLREQSWGAWVSSYRHQLKSDPDFLAYLADLETVCPPGGGESCSLLKERAANVFDRLALDAAGRGDTRPVISVSHGGVIRAALAHAEGVAYTEGLKIHTKVEPLSVTRIRARVGRENNVSWQIASVNWLAERTPRGMPQPAPIL